MSRHCRHLIGNLYGKHIYEPPLRSDENEQQVINLEKVSTMRTCLVSCDYGRLERRGIVFQFIDDKEIQVNFCSIRDAESEYEELKHILAKL